MTLGEALLERRNALNVVRLVLAASVVLAHAWTVGDEGQTPTWAQPFGALAVPGFFCLSGFLIAHSRMRLSLPRFMWHRALRVLPGLWVVLVITALVAAPLSVLAGGSWTAGAALDYVLGNALLPLDWSLRGTVDGAAWNKSLWSLPCEFLAYIFVGAFLSVAVLRQHLAVAIVATYAGVVTSSWLTLGRVNAHDMAASPAGHALICFLGGMVLYAMSDRIQINARLALAALVAVVALWSSGLMVALGALPLAYLVLYAGAAIPARWAHRHDISYGVYIYAFPVQVLLEWFAPNLPVGAHVLAALMIMIPLGLASWLLIERPAMRWRDAGRPVAMARTMPAS